MSAIVYWDRLDHNTWTVSTTKCYKKGLSTNNFTEANNTYPLPTANRYEQISNFQDTLVNYATSKTQGVTKTTDIPKYDHQIKLHYQSSERTWRIVTTNREDSLYQKLNSDNTK
jgi:hypothetical protein